MRIIAGTHRGRPLLSPKDSTVRPTTDRTREALFNILQHRYPQPDGTSRLQQARVLDMFCGSGALGLEALSRGAAQATFIDASREALALARQNATSLHLLDKTTFVLGDSLTHTGIGPFDMVFIDPPYGKTVADQALVHLLQQAMLAPNALVVVETAKEEELTIPAALTLDDKRVYATSKIWLLTIYSHST